MNGNVGPVRPMQNNRQMGRVNGSPYPNGGGKVHLKINLTISLLLNEY